MVIFPGLTSVTENSRPWGITLNRNDTYDCNGDRSTSPIDYLGGEEVSSVVYRCDNTDLSIMFSGITKMIKVCWPNYNAGQEFAWSLAFKEAPHDFTTDANCCLDKCDACPYNPSSHQRSFENNWNQI